MGVHTPRMLRILSGTDPGSFLYLRGEATCEIQICTYNGNQEARG